MITYEKALELLDEGRKIVEIVTGSRDGRIDYCFNIGGSYSTFRVDQQAFLRLVKRMEIRRNGDKSNMWIITDKGRQRYADLVRETKTATEATV